MKTKPTDTITTITRLESEAAALEARRQTLADAVSAARANVDRLKRGMGARILADESATALAAELGDAERQLAVIEAGHSAAVDALAAAQQAVRDETEQAHLLAAQQAAEAFKAKQKDLRTVSDALQAALRDLGAIRDELAGHTSGFSVANPRWGQANAAQMGIDGELRRLRKLAGELAEAVG